MKDLQNDVTDMMTNRHLHLRGSLVTHGTPSMTVGELIELLRQFDPAEEVFVLRFLRLLPDNL